MQKRFMRGARRETQRGITLLEMMIVLAIIAMVTGSLFIWLKGSSDKAKVKTAKVTAKSFMTVYEEWTADEENAGQSCPESIDSLVEYAKTSSDLSDKEKKKMASDPWGSPWIIRCGETGGLPEGKVFGVMSLGKDKKEGTKDDIKSWDEN